MEEKDNIKVAIRIRPINGRETQELSTERCLSVDPEQHAICLVSYPSNRYFAYDYIASESVSQEEIFEIVAKPISSSCLSGYNGTIFAYGQTGAGKTYTIFGPPSQDLHENPVRGILPRSIEFLFAVLHEKVSSESIEFLIKASFLEIYNETINDLLNIQMKNLQIREDMKKGAYVEGLTEQTVFSIEEVYTLLSIGTKNRHIGETYMNRESSRSHSVFTLTVEIKEQSQNLLKFKSSRFNLIDLAGSERQKLTATGGDRLKEAGMINKSLSALGNVINSLVEISEGKCRHVHYRDSKLTFLLKDSLGGNSKTCIVANISPGSCCYGETLSTLRFAERAKLVKNRAIVNEDTIGTVAELKEEIRRLKEELQSAARPKSTHIDVDLVKMNERILEVEQLLEESVRIRITHEASRAEELQNKEKQLEGLSEVVKKFEQKSTADKMIIKFRDETIRKIQAGRQLTEIQIVKELKEETNNLRKELANNPVLSKLAVENEVLKSYTKSLEKEIKESPDSLQNRIRESLEFTYKLNLNVKKSAIERRQLLSLINELNRPPKRSNEDLQLQIGYLQSTVSELQQELQQRNGHFAEGEVENDDLRFSDMSSITITESLTPLCFSSKESEKKHSQELNKITSELQKRLKELTKAKDKNKRAVKEKKTYNVKTVQLEEEVVKLSDDIERREETLQTVQQQMEEATLENQFLSINLARTTHELTEKNRIIQEVTSQHGGLSDSLQLRAQQEHHVAGLQLAHDHHKAQAEQLSQDLQLSISNREQLLQELRNLQSLEYTLRNENTDLRQELIDLTKENENVSRDMGSSNEGEKLQISLNQKIKLFTRMKEENNKLKQQNHKIREDARRNHERLEDLQKKYEILSKARGKRELDTIEETQYRRKLERYQQLIDKYQVNEEKVLSLLARKHAEVSGADLCEDIEQLCADLTIKDSQLVELQTELARKESSMQLLENEFLLFKQKAELHSKF